MSLPKTYLKNSPSKFTIALSLNRKPETKDDQVKEVLASLINYFSSSKEVPDNIHTLVAINPALIGYPSKTDIFPRSNQRASMPNTQNDALVLAGCESVNDLVFIQRVCKSVLTPFLYLHECIDGSRLRYGQEPFGFYHPEASDDNKADKVAIIDDGELKGGSWLLTQRYVQTVEKFYQLPESQRDDVMGAKQIAQHDDPTPSYPATAHTNASQAGSNQPLMARRGFTYAVNGEEGVFFVGMTQNTDFFSQTLNAMLDSDALLNYADAVTGSIYYAPPSGDFLAENAPAINTPDEARALLLIDKDSGEAWPIADCTVMSATMVYIDLLREHGLFIGPVGGMSINPDVQTMLTAIHEVLAGGTVTNKPSVENFDEQLVESMQSEFDKIGNGANQLNLLAKKYVTWH